MGRQHSGAHVARSRPGTTDVGEASLAVCGAGWRLKLTTLKNYDPGYEKVISHCLSPALLQDRHCVSLIFCVEFKLRCKTDRIHNRGGFQWAKVILQLKSQAKIRFRCEGTSC